MDMAKSLFGTRDHDGYVGREEHSVSVSFFLYILCFEIGDEFRLRFLFDILILSIYRKR